MDPKQLWATTMNPKTHAMQVQFTEENAREILQVFRDLMGIEVERRKEFIMQEMLKKQIWIFKKFKKEKIMKKDDNIDTSILHLGNIEEIAQQKYLDYAMSVITSRALPDVRDGLKPVQRRILYAMHVLGIKSNSAFKKSARIVGDTIGKYHPHGDISVYGSYGSFGSTFQHAYVVSRRSRKLWLFER